MSEKDFLSQDLRDFLYDPMENSEKGKELQDSGKISSATRTILSDGNFLYNLDNVFLKNLDDFLSTSNSSNFKVKFNELDSLIKNNENIKEQSQKQGLLLGILLVKLDLLERANYKNYDIYNEIKSEISSSFGSIVNNRDEISDLIEDSLFAKYIGSSLRLEGEPSQYFAKSFIEAYKEKFKTPPKIGDFGNIYCVLLSQNQTIDNLEFLKQNMDPEDLIAYSSNQGKRLPEKDKRKSTLFEERVDKTESTLIERGNLNYMSELVRHYMENNYNNKLNNEKNLEGFNSYFARAFNDLINFISINKGNSEIINEVNYMLNCPINIKEGCYTTLADFVKNELRFNRKLAPEKRDIFQKFEKVLGIEPDQNLNIPGLKLMTAEEVIAKYGTEIEKETKTKPEFMLETYGANSITKEELNTLINEREPLKKITINERVLLPLLNNNFLNFSDLTLTPRALCFAKSFTDNKKDVNKPSLNGVKVKIDGQDIDEDSLKAIYSIKNHKDLDFTGANFTDDFSDAGKLAVLELTGFNEIIKSINEKTDDIKQIEDYVNNISSTLKKYGLKNIVNKNVSNKLDEIKADFKNYNEKNGFMKRQNKNKIIKGFEEFKKMDILTGKVQKNLSFS